MSDYRINIRSDVPDAKSIESSDSLFGLFGGDFAKITFEQLFQKFIEDDTVANSKITITESEGETQTTITVVEAVQYLFDGLKELDDNKASKTIYIGKIKYSVDEIITEIADKLQSNTSFVRSLMLKNEYFGNITDVSDLSILLQNAPDEIKNDFRGDMYKIVHVLLNIIKKVKEYASHGSGDGGGVPAKHTHPVDDIYKATTVGGSWNSNFANIVPDLVDAISCNPDFVQYIEERNRSIEDFVEDYGIFMQGDEPVTDSSGNNWFILIFGLINRTIKEKVAPKSSLYDMQYGNVVKLLGEVEGAEDLDKIVLNASDKDVHFVLGDTAIDNLIITDKIELFTLLAGGGLEPQSPEDVDALVAKYGNKVITVSLQKANEDGTPLDVDGMSISDFYESDSFIHNFTTQCFLIASADIVAPIMEAESEEEAMSQFKFSIDEVEAESIEKTPLLKIVAGTANTAEQAQSTAESAQSTANNAQSTADSAQNTANNAQSTAEQAQSTAEQAQTAINTAVANFLTETQIRTIVQEMIDTATNKMVESNTITDIEKMTESEYEALETKSETTMYAVVEDEVVGNA